MNYTNIVRKAAALGCLLVAAASAFGQTKSKGTSPSSPSMVKAALDAPDAVTQIDEVRLKKLLQPNGKPLLVNFWATWCDPCREEFPELVKIDTEYKGRIDFITITLDDAADIKGPVPKFLADMKARMPSYLLVTSDESAAISSIAKDWSGGLPFTVLYNDKGEMAYFRQGKVQADVLRSELDKLAAPAMKASN